MRNAREAGQPPDGPLEAVLLDLDGTLIASEELDIRSMDRLFREELGLQKSEEELRRYLGYTSRAVLEEVAPTRVDYLLARWLALLDEMRHLAVPYPGVRAALKQLASAGLRLAVVTAQNRSEVDGTRNRLALDDLIDVWITADDASRPKPAADPVHAALLALAVTPEKAVMVGDNPFDMMAGQAAGTSIAAALWGVRDPRTLLTFEPDYVLYQTQDLAQLLLPPTRPHEDCVETR
jgi:pyrophosphatase PpaX